MKLTVNQLRRIIKEEVTAVVEAARRPATPLEELVGETVAAITGVPDFEGANWRATAKELQRLRRQSLRRAAAPRKYRPGEEWKASHYARYDAERQGDELSSHLQADIVAAIEAMKIDDETGDEVFSMATEIGKSLLDSMATGKFDV